MSIAAAAGGLGQWMPDILRELAERVEVRAAPRSAHWVPEENPGFVTDALLDFSG